jgi:hypothetical protein
MYLGLLKMSGLLHAKNAYAQRTLTVSHYWLNKTKRRLTTDPLYSINDGFFLSDIFVPLSFNIKIVSQRQPTVYDGKEMLEDP